EARSSWSSNRDRSGTGVPWSKRMRTRRAESGLRQAARGVFEHGLDLPALDSGKPLEKVIDARPGLEVLEKRPDRNPRPPEDPHAADLRGIPLHRVTLTPVKHDQTPVVS